MILKKYVLSDIAEILNHKRIPLNSQEREKRRGPYPYYGASGVVDFVDDYLFDGEYVLISEDGENLRSRKTPIAFKAAGKFWVNNHAHIVKGVEPFLNDWIVYYFSKTDVNPFLTGAVQPKLSKESLLNIPIYLPDFGEAKAITEILSSLDDKIELNNQINQNLEALAQAIFKRWFVDFEFPNENGQPYKSSGGKMVGSEFGEIPNGWSISSISAIATISKEGTNPLLRAQEDFYHYSIPAFDDGKTARRERGEFIKSSKFTISGPSILVSKLNPKTPRIWPIISLEDNSICSTEFLVFRPIQLYSFEFLYGLFTSQMFTNLLISRASGTSGSHQRVKPSDISAMSVVIPSEKIMISFHNTMQNILEMIEHNVKEVQTLTNLRDAILPRLISGGLKMLPHERMVEV